MDLPNVDKKLREARFFLALMVNRQQRAFGAHEGFDFYLSAFLSASRSVDYRLRHEQAVLYKPGRATWETGLTVTKDRLMKFMADDRAVEIHESGSQRQQGATRIPVGNMYHDESGTLYNFSPPGRGMTAGRRSGAVDDVDANGSGDSFQIVERTGSRHGVSPAISAGESVNPIIAVFLGWLFAGETLTGTTLAAGAVIIAAVAWLILTQMRSAKPPIPAGKLEDRGERLPARIGSK